MKTYEFVLKVDNGYDLQNSTLFWKQSYDEIKSATIKSRENYLALFEIQAKPGQIEYWYKNYKQEKEKVKRRINLEQDNTKTKIKYDRFDCLNLIVKCQINSSNLTQYSQLYYIGKEIRKLITFEEENLIYIPFSSEQKVQFLIEHLDGEEKLREIQFHILLSDLFRSGNSLQLNIYRDNLEALIFTESRTFIQQNEIVQFYIDSRNERGFDEVLFYKYQECVSDTQQQSTRMNTFSQVTQKKISESIKKIGNFFSNEKQVTSNSQMQLNLIQSQIIANRGIQGNESTFRKTEGFSKGPEKMKEEFDKKNRELKTALDLNKICEQIRHNVEEQINVEQSTQLQVSIFDNSIEQHEKQELIKIIQQKDEMINQLTTTINDLRVQVQDFTIKLIQEKENANDQAKRYQMKFIQNFRARRCSPPKKNKIYSQSQSQQQLEKNIMQLNPIILSAKQLYPDDLSSSYYPISTSTGFRHQNDTKSKTLKTEASYRYQ